MAKFNWDHIHIRTPDVEATAQWFEKMLGAEIKRSTQQGAPRVVLCSADGVFALSGRGWQRLAVQPPIEALRPPGAIGILVPGAGGEGATNGRRSSSTGASEPDR